MPKLGFVLLATALVVCAGSGYAVVAHAQDAEGLRAELRLKETESMLAGSDEGRDGSFVLSIAARNADTAGLASVGVAAGDVDVTFPLTRGRFLGRIRSGGVDVRASVLAKRGRVTVRMEGTIRDGVGSVFGTQSFDACSDHTHWGGTFYGIEWATLTLDAESHVIPVGIAGRSDRRRRGHSAFESPRDDFYRVELNALGRLVGEERARADVQFAPRFSNERWDGRLRGQVLVTNAQDAVLKMSLDGGEPERIDPFDAEALEISTTDRVAEGVVSRQFGLTTVTQIRFDTAMPARPGLHTATAIASGTDLEGSEAPRRFVMPENAPPLLIDVNEHALEMRLPGIVWAWGENRFGVVGNGVNERNPKSPVPLLGPMGVISVGAGELVSVAVDGDGTTWLWGRYDNNTTPYGSFPEVFPGLPQLESIAAGFNHVVGLDVSGRVWTFGKNGDGQLGDGTVQDRMHEPLRLTGIPPMSAVAAGAAATAALDEEGRVWAWGDQNLDGIGNGKRPVLVEGLPPIQALDVGANTVDGRVVVLGNNGTVWTWGGPDDEDSTPSRVAGLRDIVAVSCGGRHDLALSEDGTVWAWGFNHMGQFGDGMRSLVEAPVPVQVRDLRRIVRIAAGVDASFAVDADGATWIFGDTRDFLGDWGASHVASLAPREFVPGNYRRPDDEVGAK